MDKLLRICAWFVSYLSVTVLSVIVTACCMDGLWPGYQYKEQYSGPVEQQFYLLLADKCRWMNKVNRDGNFKKGLTERGRERFSAVINEIRFKRDCRSGEDNNYSNQMSCAVDGKDIIFSDQTIR